MDELSFSVSPDRQVKAMTYGILALLLGTLAFVGIIIYKNEGFSTGFYTTLLLMLATYIPIIALAWAYSPDKYLLTGKGVIIKRPAKDIVLPYSEIKSVEIRESLGTHMIRQIGNGGLFSFSGTFRSKEEGKMKMYLKNSNYVLIITKNGEKWVVSPDERDYFVMSLKARIRS